MHMVIGEIIRTQSAHEVSNNNKGFCAGELASDCLEFVILGPSDGEAGAHDCLQETEPRLPLLRHQLAGMPVCGIQPHTRTSLFSYSVAFITSTSYTVTCTVGYTPIL